MSSTILPVAASGQAASDTVAGTAAPGSLPAERTGTARDPFLTRLGEQVRALRARAGMTRKALSQATGVSERHLANLEYGSGNASILILLSVAQALHCPLADLLGDTSMHSAEWLLIRDMLQGCDEATLRKLRISIGEQLGRGGAHGEGLHPRSRRIALIGLRGAGKTTLGTMLAEDLDCPFIELSREIEKFAGCSVSEIQALYGQSAYRRHERRALEETIQAYPAAIIAAPGGIVSEPGTFNLLLAHCSTIWLQASPEDHMNRVLEQGDTRPITASGEAMQDLKAILTGRAPFYAKAEHAVDTSAAPLPDTFAAVQACARRILQGEGFDRQESAH